MKWCPVHTFVSATEMAWAITSECSLCKAQQKITHTVTILATAGYWNKNLLLRDICTEKAAFIITTEFWELLWITAVKCLWHCEAKYNTMFWKWNGRQLFNSKETHINTDISKQFVTANGFILTQQISGPYSSKFFSLTWLFGLHRTMLKTKDRNLSNWPT